MKRSYRDLMLATALAAVLTAAPFTIVIAPAQERGTLPTTLPTDPGFKPDTGQINPGVTEQAPSWSTEIVEKIPTPAESRAALRTPVSKQPSTGEAQQASAPQGNTQQAAQGDAQQAAQGDAQQAAAPQGNGAAGQLPAHTTGAGSSAAAAQPASAEPPPSGPIGSVGETIPAKFSKRNDILDRTPIMALPQALTDQERKQIYDAVMADKTQPAENADALIPTSELSTSQALDGMHPLPADVHGIANVQKLQYVKGKTKVLLVEPSTRTVVDQIKS